MSLKNIFGYSYSTNEINYDTDYSPYPFIQQYAPDALLTRRRSGDRNQQDQDVLERIAVAGHGASTIGWNILLGVFYLDATEDYFSPLWLGAFNFAVAYNAITGQQDVRGLRAGNVQAHRRS